MGEGYKESMSFMYALCKSGGYVGDLDTPDYIRSEAVYELWDGDLNEDLLRAADAFVSVLEERYHGNGFDFIKDEREPRFGDMVYVTDDQEIVIDLVYGKNVTQGRTFLKSDLFGTEYPNEEIPEIVNHFIKKGRIPELFTSLMRDEDYYQYNVMTHGWIAVNIHGTLNEPKISLPAGVIVTQRRNAVVLEYDNGWTITLSTKRKKDLIMVTWKKK